MASAPTLYDVPLCCSECDGDGGAEVQVCRVPYHRGNCPCGGEWVACPRCEGTGEEPCDYCPDSPAVRRTEDGEQVCRRCYREVVLGVEDSPDHVGRRDPEPARAGHGRGSRIRAQIRSQP